MNATDIAYRIKKIREYRNYTQTYMAGRLSIKQNTYSQIESGTHPVKPARLQLIATILTIPVSILLNHDFELFSIDEGNGAKKAGANEIYDTAILQMERIIKTLQDDVQYLRHQNDELLKTIRNTNQQNYIR